MEKIYEEKDIIVPRKLVIPEIDDERLAELYKRLKPIVSEKNIMRFLREYTLKELREKSYIWYKDEDLGEIVDPSRLEPLEDFTCLHTWAWYGYFKPTVAEVLSQAPADTLEEANAFEIVRQGDIGKYWDITNQGFHLSLVRSYKIHE